MISHDVREALSEDISDDASNLRWKKRKVLGALRSSYSMDVAFISRFTRSQRVFEEVDCAPDLPFRIAANDTGPITSSYCHRISRGRTPSLMTDARKEITVADITETNDFPIGGHVSVPITLSGGEVYGMLCAFSRKPRPDLKPRDLCVFQLCADLLGRDIETLSQRNGQNDPLEDATMEAELSLFLQPICTLADRRILGYELLTRFPMDAAMTEAIFARARNLDRAALLESRIAALALEILKHLPERQFLTMNFSLGSLLTLEFEQMFPPEARSKIVLELTEHERVHDYENLLLRIEMLKDMGFRFAVDDVGAGFSSFRHVLKLRPEIIKLDRSLITAITVDSPHAGMITGLRDFARVRSATIIAEGIETEAEIAALQQLGLFAGQGYLLGRPKPWREVLA